MEKDLPIADTTISIPKMAKEFTSARLRAYPLSTGEFVLTAELLDSPPGSGKTRNISTKFKVEGSDRFDGRPLAIMEADEDGFPPTASDIENYFAGYTGVGILYIE